MEKSRPVPGIKRLFILTGLLTALLSGCTIVGPATISSGRLAYNEAITATDNQQMLMVLVHERYGERGHLLNVASVTANVSVTTSAGIQAGFGSTSDYRGNLVPFAGSVIYEENPTISYAPVAGEKYLRQLTTPISTEMLTQLIRSHADPGSVLVALVREVNGIHNPNFYFANQGDDPRFDEVTRLVTELTHGHRLHWVERSGKEGEFSLVIDQSDPTYASQVRQLLQLLDLPPAPQQEPLLVIPIKLALGGSKDGGVGISTRSVWDMVAILAARVEVPEADQHDGIVVQAPPPGRLGRTLQINYTSEEPENAYIAVEYRDGWFYIDERDMATKQYFKLLGGLWSMVMSNAAGQGAAAPVLTLGVSR
jgi:hypothetical protein